MNSIVLKEISFHSPHIVKFQINERRSGFAFCQHNPLLQNVLQKNHLTEITLKFSIHRKRANVIENKKKREKECNVLLKLITKLNLKLNIKILPQSSPPTTHILSKLLVTLR